MRLSPFKRLPVPEAIEEEIDVLLGLEPELGERRHDLNVDGGVGGTVQRHRLQQVLDLIPKKLLTIIGERRHDLNVDGGVGGTVQRHCLQQVLDLIPNKN
jgi:hypothetical protein